MQPLDHLDDAEAEGGTDDPQVVDADREHLSVEVLPVELDLAEEALQRLRLEPSRCLETDEVDPDLGLVRRPRQGLGVGRRSPSRLPGKSWSSGTS